MDKLMIKPALTDEALKEISVLADEIWHEHFTPIIGEKQVDYMLEKFQSYQAIANQVKEDGYEYFQFLYDGEEAGYLAIKEEPERLFLSKIYVKKSFRGRKIASQAIRFLADRCREKGVSAIWLTVNRENKNSIAAYETMGFVRTKEQKADIGNGFYMDDYIMEKPVA